MAAEIADSLQGMIFSEDEARAWWLELLHPAGAFCPRCGVYLAGSKLETFAAGARVECLECGKWFEIKAGTQLAGCHASWRQLYLLALLCALAGDGVAISPKQIADLCGFSIESAVRLLARLVELDQ